MASDSGSGKLGDYKYNLVPANRRVTIRLADSDPYQEELASLEGEENLVTFIAARTIEEERTDAPMPVRFFTGRRMSGIVGYVPRGLEPAVIDQAAPECRERPAVAARGQALEACHERPLLGGRVTGGGHHEATTSGV